MNVIFDNPLALEPLFDETVAVVAVRQGRTVRGGFAACTFPIQFDDPFADDKNQATRQRFAVLIAKSGHRAWNEKTPPQIGDEITLTSGMKTSVVKVSQSVTGCYELEVRQC